MASLTSIEESVDRNNQLNEVACANVSLSSDFGPLVSESSDSTLGALHVDANDALITAPKSSVTNDDPASPSAGMTRLSRANTMEVDRMNSEPVYPAPLQASLGDLGRTELTHQMIDIVHKLWVILRRGVQAIKHSKSSKPHFRKLYCDVNMTRLFWRDSHEAGNDLDLKPAKNRNSKLFGRRNSITKSDSEREILFSDITKVM